MANNVSVAQGTEWVLKAAHEDFPGACLAAVPGCRKCMRSLRCHHPDRICTQVCVDRRRTFTEHPFWHAAYHKAEQRFDSARLRARRQEWRRTTARAKCPSCQRRGDSLHRTYRSRRR